MARSVVLVVPKSGYREKDLVDAAHRLGLEPMRASDRCHQLDVVDGALPLDFSNPRVAARMLAEHVRTHAPVAVIGTDEASALIAARTSALLGLPHASAEALEATRDKALFRKLLARAGEPGPKSAVLPLDADPALLARHVSFPCVLKPLSLSGSRGVMRADDPASFVLAFTRLQKLLRSPDLRAREDPLLDLALSEDFVPGAEVALEGLLTDGRLDVLALFDKPDALDGPFFEETLYVTPSRHAPELQRLITDRASSAARAIGLTEGPVHAELRLSPSGPVVIELAARSIGGLCGRVLRFGVGVSLEELVLTHALGRSAASRPRPPAREAGAAGVMMLPIRKGGILRAVHGLDEARDVRGIDAVTITAREGDELVPLPEGASYLGFLFARGREPAEVEAALRMASALLHVELVRKLPLA